MTKKEATELLKNAVRDETPSRINKIFTCRKFVELIERWVAEKEDDYVIEGIFELRVRQAVKNQRRPRY